MENSKSYLFQWHYTLTSIFLISAFLLSCSVLNNKTTSAHESNIPKDTMEFQCEDWKKPSDDEVRFLLFTMRPLTSNEWHHCYGDWSCSKEGALDYNNSIYNFRVDAAGFIILSKENEQLYFGCYTEDCWNYFPKSAGTDCDSLGNVKE